MNKYFEVAEMVCESVEFKNPTVTVPVVEAIDYANRTGCWVERVNWVGGTSSWAKSFKQNGKTVKIGAGVYGDNPVVLVV